MKRVAQEQAVLVIGDWRIRPLGHQVAIQVDSLANFQRVLADAFLARLLNLQLPPGSVVSVGGMVDGDLDQALLLFV